MLPLLIYISFENHEDYQLYFLLDASYKKAFQLNVDRPTSPVGGGSNWTALNTSRGITVLWGPSLNIPRSQDWELGVPVWWR